MTTMSQTEAWKWIVDHWGCPSWTGIPDWVRNIIGLDSRLGMCNYSLVTQMGAKGMREFINRINSRKI